MRFTRLNLPPILLPRALAVLSCALALLTAAPTLPAQANSAPAITISNTVPVETASKANKTRQNAAQLAAQARSSNESFFSSARHLHILATVEIFKRLLWGGSDIQSEHALQPVLVLEPFCLQLTPVPLYVPATAVERLLPSPERQFAIEHCLLAPPCA